MLLYVSGLVVRLLNATLLLHAHNPLLLHLNPLQLLQTLLLLKHVVQLGLGNFFMGFCRGLVVRSFSLN